ncbi:MAG: glutamate--tRNA ligase [Candidatus Peribacteraceae bacterium]|nr:glutamate--tRNA ligase [Candidatus Peribacteraceae bacterium]
MSRTRFAPSPTGMLHVGGLRTALFNYLYAKKNEGTFILRIEDTDRERYEEGTEENILKTLDWAKLNPDEGVTLEGEKGDKKPYHQSERLDVYKKAIDKLLESKNAYYAFDTTEELNRMREEEKKAGNPAPKYDISMRMRMKNSLTLSEEEVKNKIDAGDEYVIRLKVPDNHTVKVFDEIRGALEFKSSSIDDAVLLKSDGFPTYHLANIVDDNAMDIDMVIRGEEWLPSLPKHVLLYEAFGWNMPKFAHVPLLLNPSGGKLSKRQGDVSVSDFIERGYLPEVMINFLALLGWNPGTTDEIFSLDELIEKFSLDRVQKGGAIFDTEKLDWLQGQWIRKFTPKEFAERIQPIVAKEFPDARKDSKFVEKAQLIQDRITFFKEASEMLSFFYLDPKVDLELIASKKQKVTKDMVADIVSMLIETLEKISTWNEETIKESIIKLAKEKELKNGQVLWPLRAILTGLPYSPGAFEVAEVLGKDETLKRLAKALELVKK